MVDGVLYGGQSVLRPSLFGQRRLVPFRGAAVIAVSRHTQGVCHANTLSGLRGGFRRTVLWENVLERPDGGVNWRLLNGFFRMFHVKLSRPKAGPRGISLSHPSSSPILSLST